MKKFASGNNKFIAISVIAALLILVLAAEGFVNIPSLYLFGSEINLPSRYRIRYLLSGLYVLNPTKTEKQNAETYLSDLFGVVVSKANFDSVTHPSVWLEFSPVTGKYSGFIDVANKRLYFYRIEAVFPSANTYSHSDVLVIEYCKVNGVPLQLNIFIKNPGFITVYSSFTIQNGNGDVLAAFSYGNYGKLFLEKRSALAPEVSFADSKNRKDVLCGNATFVVRKSYLKKVKIFDPLSGDFYETPAEFAGALSEHPFLEGMGLNAVAGMRVYGFQKEFSTAFCKAVYGKENFTNSFAKAGIYRIEERFVFCFWGNVLRCSLYPQPSGSENWPSDCGKSVSPYPVNPCESRVAKSWKIRYSARCSNGERSHAALDFDAEIPISSNHCVFSYPWNDWNTRGSGSNAKSPDRNGYVTAVFFINNSPSVRHTADFSASMGYAVYLRSKKHSDLFFVRFSVKLPGATLDDSG